MRGILVLTCSAVSFAHGTNDGQKSIGLIMLTIIGLFPATYALNPTSNESLQDLAALMRQAAPLVARYGDDEKQDALGAVQSIERRAMEDQAKHPAAKKIKLEVGLQSPPARARSSVRDDVYRIISQLKHAEESPGIDKEDNKTVQEISKRLGSAVEYAPVWVRMLSAVCLGLGTMIGYQRIVKTLDERLGNVHLTPAQGASTEIVSAILIGTAGFTGLPVSTTHIVTSGAGLRYRMISRVVIAWLVTLPVTIVIAGGLYYLLASPNL
jgi:PiT family inorganic phosphate transporter